MSEADTKRAFPEAMSFRACIYPADFDSSYFTAHCLELDLMGQDKTLAGAVAQLLEAIETQLNTCMETGAQFECWAPSHVWFKYSHAKKANRTIPAELLERIVNAANRRIGYESPVNIDTMTADTPEVYSQCQAVPA